MNNYFFNIRKLICMLIVLNYILKSKKKIMKVDYNGIYKDIENNLRTCELTNHIWF